MRAHRHNRALSPFPPLTRSPPLLLICMYVFIYTLKRHAGTVYADNDDLLVLREYGDNADVPKSDSSVTHRFQWLIPNLHYAGDAQYKIMVSHCTHTHTHTHRNTHIETHTRARTHTHAHILRERHSTPRQRQNAMQAAQKQPMARTTPDYPAPLSHTHTHTHTRSPSPSFFQVQLKLLLRCGQKWLLTLPNPCTSILVHVSSISLPNLEIANDVRT